ncbi:hypothetical protein C8Q77DRAFT_1088021 [Trametes polyzona]|nr:hypothetical protein C8Q77DRAFT_1088021 [Trametes polyzona]
MLHRARARHRAWCGDSEYDTAGVRYIPSSTNAPVGRQAGPQQEGGGRGSPLIMRAACIMPAVWRAPGGRARWNDGWQGYQAGHPDGRSLQPCGFEPRLSCPCARGRSDHVNCNGAPGGCAMDSWQAGVLRGHGARVIAAPIRYSGLRAYKAPMPGGLRARRDKTGRDGEEAGMGAGSGVSIYGRGGEHAAEEEIWRRRAGWGQRLCGAEKRGADERAREPRPGSGARGSRAGLGDWARWAGGHGWGEAQAK